jgi:endonuclease YncB( thermonuclease family)
VKRPNKLIIILTFSILPSIIISQNLKGGIVNTMRLKTSIFKIFISLLLIAALTALINTQASHAQIRTITGTITKVTDGDSIHLTTAEQTILKVRLYGIDAPETDKINYRTGQINIPGQPYGDESWNALQDKLIGNEVRVDIIEYDKYRRAVCMVWLDDRNVNLEMLQEGYAEAFIEYLKPPYRTGFLEAEQEARKSRKGIWSLPEYERPRDYRKRLRVRGGD